MPDVESGQKSKIHNASPARYQIEGSQAQVLISNGGGTMSEYQVLEPELSPELIQACSAIRIQIKQLLHDKQAYHQLSQNFNREFTRITKERYPSLTAKEIDQLAYFINRDARGLGKIQPLVDDPDVQLISITGPGQILTLQHAKYGLLFTSLILSEVEVARLIKKLCNRATKPASSNSPPHEITLRSGLLVKFSDIQGDSASRSILIEKPGRILDTPLSSHSPSEVQVMTEYRLYHNLIQVRVCKSKSGRFLYQIGTIPLSEEEKSALQSAKKEDEKRSGLKSTGGRAVRLSSDEFSNYLADSYPLIPDDRHHLLYVALSFALDPARWIRLLMTDRQVTRFRCTHPDVFITVWHKEAAREVIGCLKPRRADLNRLADFLIRSSGQTINPDDTEINLTFKTGEMVTLTRVMDDEGHYYRIDFKKTQDGSDTRNSMPGTKASRVRVLAHREKKLVPDPRIDELISTIFLREGVFEKANSESKGTDNQDPACDSPKGLAHLVASIKAGFQTINSLGSRKKDPEPDDHPVPETPQVPNVLNIQTGDGCTAEEAYWLYQPHSYVAITLDTDKERVYRVIEPELSPRERIILEETHETLRDVLVYDKPVTKGELFLDYEEVAKVVRTYDPKISDDRLSVLYYYLRRNLNGYGKIDPLMYDELLEDISCNGHNLPVYVHHRYYGSIPTSIRFESEELNRFVLKLSQKADKQVSLTSPLLDASLPNGSRAQITYSDVVSTKGSSFTIRKFRSDPMTPATLLSFGTYSDELLAFIWLALENRQSMIVVGGTASGKTSAMNAFSFFIPHNSKIVSLEDTREIQIPQKNWLPVQTRTANTFNDRGSVDLFDLLKASLRQRPEYIIVGEVRGSEAQTLFQAMNSGHTTVSTLHAGNIEEALNRLTNEPINVPPAMFGALNLMVIQTFHYRDGRMIRRCDAIHEIVLGEGDKVKWNTLFEYEPQDDSFKRAYKKSKTLQTIQYMHNWSDDEIRYHLDIRAAFLARLKNQHSTNSEMLIQMITDLRRMA